MMPPFLKPCVKVGSHGGMVNLHAENGVVIQALIEEALEQGNTSPKYHQLTRPQPDGRGSGPSGDSHCRTGGSATYIVHLSARKPWKRWWKPAIAASMPLPKPAPTTCFWTTKKYDRPGFEAAKYVMTPPLRDHKCQHALWRGLQVR
jgi:dihydropyrimidinase